MAIGHRATGTAAFGVDDFTPGIPATTTTGDMMILLVGGKPYNATFGASMAPGWTQLSVFTDGTAAAGNDSGSMQVTAWYKEHDGSEADPLVDEGGTAFNSMTGIVMTFSKDGGDTWSTPVIVGGGDATAGTGFSVTAGSDPGVTTGDHCISFAAFRSDSATPCSSHLTPTQTGITFSNTHDPATDPETGAGGDMGMCITRSTVSGTSSAAPVMAATLGGSHTGSAAFIRLRVSSGTPGSVTPGVIARSATIPSVTVKGGAVKSPATTARSAVIPAATAKGAATTTPSVIARSATVDAPTVKGAAKTTPSVIARSATVDAPTVKGGAVTTPNVVARSVVIPQATGADSGSPRTVTPDVISRASTLPAPTVKGGAVVAPAVIDRVVSIHQVTKVGGGKVTPSVTTLAAVIPQATASAGATTVTPNVIARSAALGTVTLKAGATATPAAIATAATLHQALARAAAVAAPNTILVVVAIDQASAFEGEPPPDGTVQDGDLLVLVIDGKYVVSGLSGSQSTSNVSGALRVGSQG